MKGMREEQRQESKIFRFRARGTRKMVIIGG